MSRRINEYTRLKKTYRRFTAIQQAEVTAERYCLITKYRNLTTKEAIEFYNAMLQLRIASPQQIATMQLEQLGMPLSEESIRRQSQWGNGKRDAIRQLTWQLDMQEDGDSYVARCPCCQRYVAPTRVAWFIKPYYIASGFIKVCRECASKYGESYLPDLIINYHCISVYHPQYMQCYNDHGPEVALTVFREYIVRGIVYDSNNEAMQQQADKYMAHVICKLDSSMNKERK